nr:T9SS type A sorting domain-containing protein [Pontibacter korlensis]
MLQANAVTSGTGTWSQVNGPTTASFSSTTNPNATAGNLTPGTYVFRWTVRTDCSSTPYTAASEVTIIVNCDASYTLAVPKYRDEYRQNEVIATASDPDGTINSASIERGTLPPGTTISSTSGNISVVNPANLVEGTYPLSIRLTDQYNRTTLTDIVLRIYGDSPAIVPLPVELVYFRAAVQQSQVKLQWLTASEENNKAFVVERSADGKQFSPIGTVAGAGTTVQPQHYSFVDSEYFSGTTYYRLKQIDFDGEFAYSNVVAVRKGGQNAQENTLKVWPNPFEQEVSIEVFSGTAEEASIDLTDMQGRQVHRATVQLKPGLNELNLPLKGISTGMYILRLQTKAINQTAKVIRK